METRANYALIGLFTLAVVAAAFGFVYWFSGGDRGQARQQVRIVFSGSVSGLSRGSAVLFNGLRVGEVTDISLLPEDPRRVVSVVELDRATPVRTDTRARLEYQGLTGVAQIALIGGEPGAPPLVAGPGQPLPTIFADQSDFQDLLESARNIARRADDVLEKVGRLVEDNEGAIGRTVQNVETFSRALSDNAPGIDRLLEQVGRAAERVGPLAEKLEVLAVRVDEVVQAVDRDRVARIVANVDAFTQTLGENRQILAETLRDAGSLVRQLDAAAPKLDAAVTDIGNVARAFDPAKVGRALDNVDRFAQALGNRSQDVDRIVQNVDRVVQNADLFAQTLSENRQAVADAVRDAGGLMRQLNASAPKLDSALTDVGNLARAFDPAKVGRSVDNIDRFAQALGNRSPEVDRIVQNLDGFAQTLSENRQVVADALRDAGGLVRQLNATAPKLDTALTDVGNFARAFDPAKVGRSVDNIDRFTQALGNRSEDVDKAIGEARQIAEKLNRSADRVDNVLKAAENFLGSAAGKEGESTFGEIREAARSIRVLADNLDKRTAQIASGINRFTGTGLREYEALAADGRRTVNDIGRAVRSLERNPQQLIFGGGQQSIPQYNGRR